MNIPASTPVFLCLPAMGVEARFYRGFARSLQERTGAIAMTCDLLCRGGARKEAGEFGYREIVEEQIPMLVADARRRHPGPIILCGHSLGGQLGLLAAGLMHKPPDALVLLAAGTAHYAAWPTSERRRARAFVHLIAAAARIMPWYPGDLLGFGGDQPRRLMRDWTFNATTGRYRLEGSAHDEASIAAQVAKLRLPLLSIGLMGDRVAPEGAQEELLAHASVADVVRVHIDDSRLGSPWQRHFQWTREPSRVVEAIAQWLPTVAPCNNANSRPSQALPARTATFARGDREDGRRIACDGNECGATV